MQENLLIQIVFPESDIPQEYLNLIDSVDNTKFVPLCNAKRNDIGVTYSWNSINKEIECKTIIIHTSLNALLDNGNLLESSFGKFERINIVIRDLEFIHDADLVMYGKWLDRMAERLTNRIVCGSNGQLNILTDRLSLESMRNCNAGYETITVAPDGNFYVCPAFYYGNDTSVGNPSEGLNIPNRHLYELKNAPICRKCDAWHCHRCVWLNKLKTMEVNTPGHIQCIMAHLERNASRLILKKIENLNFKHNYHEIPKIDYLDPFETLI